MIAQWIRSYLSREIPELKTEPIRILFHIAAELATAAALIAGGAGLLANWDWGTQIYLVAIGMLLYTAIASPGYFAQRRQWVWVGIFAVLIALALVSLVCVLR